MARLGVGSIGCLIYFYECDQLTKYGRHAFVCMPILVQIKKWRHVFSPPEANGSVGPLVDVNRWKTYPRQAHSTIFGLTNSCFVRELLIPNWPPGLGYTLFMLSQFLYESKTDFFFLPKNWVVDLDLYKEFLLFNAFFVWNKISATANKRGLSLTIESFF